MNRVQSLTLRRSNRKKLIMNQYSCTLCCSYWQLRLR